MELDHDRCYRALRTRDRRFDGRFYTGVTSTGVYCRPICPARTPRAEYCVFFACAAAAEEAGYRPCRRCRPETAPGTPAWRGTSATVSRALRLIADGALDGSGVEDLAARLGVGGRHLRRLFAEQLGASPLAVAHTRRAHFAKRLVEETRLPMAQVASAAGYRNVRRFNAAVRGTFDRTPSEIRRQVRPAGHRDSGEAARAGRASDGVLTMHLGYREPFDWDGLLDFLAPRAIPGVEIVERGVYRRSVELGDFAGVIEVAPDPGGKGYLLLRVPVAATLHLAIASERVRRLMDLDADPAAISEQLSGDPRLAGALRRCPGVRVPGAWDRFELALRAVIGQQVNVAGATCLAGRLVRAFGRPLAPGPGEDKARLPAAAATSATGRDAASHAALAGEPAWLFPRPADLAEADVAAIGLPAARAETSRGRARAIEGGEPLLEPAAGLEEAVARLVALPGIGDWTAQYIALRALGEPDAFPAGDLGLRKALADGTKLPTPAAVRRCAEAWRPWRAYAAMLLWRDSAVPGRKEIR